VGFVLRSVSLDLSRRLLKPAMLISTLSFVMSVALSLSLRQDALALVSTSGIAAMALFVIGLMAAGWLVGGPEPEARQVLAAVTNLRNVGLVYVLVDGCCGGLDYTAPVLAFMAVVVPLNLALTVFCAIQRKRRNVTG
jgi:hypothetical protein